MRRETRLSQCLACEKTAWRRSWRGRSGFCLRRGRINFQFALTSDTNLEPAGDWLSSVATTFLEIKLKYNSISETRLISGKLKPYTWKITTSTNYIALLKSFKNLFLLLKILSVQLEY
jgi:hypothetical protein